jgi:hypothetical protein
MKGRQMQSRLEFLVEEKQREIKRLRAALTKLSNEVLGSLPLMEQLCRHEFGNTNYNILIQRAEEARAILDQR